MKLNCRLKGVQKADPVSGRPFFLRSDFYSFIDFQVERQTNFLFEEKISLLIFLI